MILKTPTSRCFLSGCANWPLFLVLLCCRPTIVNANDDGWFETVSFAVPEGAPWTSLTRTRERYTTEANDGHEANFWLIQGSQAAVLIDTGFGLENLAQHLMDGGYWNASTTPLVVVASHEHFDHAAGMSVFPAATSSDVVLAAGSGDANAITESITARTADILVQEMAFYPDEYFSEAPPSVTDFAARLSDFQTQANIDRELVEGDTIELGDGAVLTIMALPGHTPGSIALYDGPSQTIFTGDTLYAGYLIDNAVDSNVDDYATSMDRLAALSVKQAYPGHGEALSGEQYLAVIDCYNGGEEDCSYVVEEIPGTVKPLSRSSSSSSTSESVPPDGNITTTAPTTTTDGGDSDTVPSGSSASSR
ncbi:Metallo-beta-lactamase domain-containing protein 2 [Seminavis robusta]|uniref:Metallo-beta-lactamase domain-containing protein 2 n=1 Tax=Seminavis robusta TaxID=568900 RepID=A0A9N8DTH9_9STRA|nr:Metallo-beta-lactamase domain-containing protein 2 [Seminavis robusta]|eukprot:Sro266_g103140.1 Metallo-beta-lactamase domain-containing protein 2 (364) ;mRNA; f:35935-37026